ncbi:hypothetical protein H0H81_009994 [Sphagnurus paluster]|uniref:RAM signaling pathway protein-domain-containing protein n=1 Tax=Sphagnurus paluster TaxID=117069 RepID=A0A9P7FPD6_9AGAR|nr:hypothetical protein H0H81_009994 [Sphagnurus paluster]
MNVGNPTLLSPHSSSLPPASLTSLHIEQALQRSLDNGATLMFSKIGLSEVSTLAVKELANIGREKPEDESPVKRNKITRLPSYLSQFLNLEVLHVEKNPIEWPPKDVMEKANNLDSHQAMRDWVRNLQEWVESDQIQDDSGYIEQNDLDTYIEESYNSWRFPLRKDQETPSKKSFTPHNRSFSVDSNFSVSSASESVQAGESLSTVRREPDRPPPLHLGILGTFSADNSPTQSLESYLPSPADSESYESISRLNPGEGQQHLRGVSYGGGLQPATLPTLLAKKSMPDLRTTKLNFRKKPTDIPALSLSSISSSRRQDDLPSSRNAQRQDSGSSYNSNRAIPTGYEVTHVSPTRTISTIAFERNSYFQRLSTLPPSTTLPKPLLCLIDSARSILFAMCQIYQSLEHYKRHAVDDRISSVLGKVLDPAGTDMMQLIASLERFDNASRKSLPSTTLCRDVIENCRDTVAVFGKAVGVLALQLKVIVSGDDIRYSRWILLELHGAAVEISCAWQAILPQTEAIRPLLRPKTFAAQSNPVGSEVYSGPPTSSTPNQLDSLVSLRPQQTSSTTGERVRTARRHAGSFSSKDVEIGKKLPSYDEPPGMLGGIVSGVAKHIPTLRLSKRQATTPMPNMSSSSLISYTSSPYIAPPFSNSFETRLHSRQGSQASLQTSSSSSPSMPSKTTFLDLPLNSKSQVGKEALHAVQTAVEVAPTIWDMMTDLFGDSLNTKRSIRETLENARLVTTRLSETLHAMQDSDVFADRKDLRDDAHAFLKIVVQLSNVIKTYRGPNIVSPSLRTNMVKLTNATEEFAILLHVSSFSAATPRSFTPLLSVSTTHSPEELRLGSSLSRSRSAQPSASFKLPSLDTPRSALHTQSFKVSGVRRLRSRENHDDLITDPG